MNTLGFIGFGKMGQAIWNGIQSTNLYQKENLIVCEANPEIKNELQNKNINVGSIADVVSTSSIIFFCVKPQVIIEILDTFPKIDLSEKLLVSILAGSSSRTFTDKLGKDIQFCRVMPNTPALVGKGMSAIYYSPTVSLEHKNDLSSIFKSFGEIIEIKEEQMNAITGISGSGPAFFYRIAKTFIETGQEQGLSYDDALLATIQTMQGAAEMLLSTGKTPDELINDVSSPNGTTVAGLNKFTELGIDESLKQVILAAVKRAEEL